MLNSEHSELLLGKAAQDEFILDLLQTNDAAPLEAYGFHAQQAAEKLLKALLAHFSVAFPPTHRLTELIDLIKDQGVAFPAALHPIIHLTPYAVIYRYEFLSLDSDEEIDKPTTRKLILDLRLWVETMTAIKPESE